MHLVYNICLGKILPNLQALHTDPLEGFKNGKVHLQADETRD